MQFINATPFPALAYQGIDQHDQRFHVVVLRQTLQWDEQGQLSLMDQQSPLCETDQYFSGKPGEGSVRQESDFCQYKPHCDVIINALAWPPQASAITNNRFKIRALIRKPDSVTDETPPEPEGLNPTMSPSREQIARWKAAIDRSKQPLAGDVLMDKVLTVTGQRYVERKSVAVRMITGAFKVGSLGLIDAEEWTLSEPEPLSPRQPIAVRLENAFGGQSLMDANAKAVSKIPKSERLTQAQAQNHPAAFQDKAPPAAHQALAANPAGCGFARSWYLQAQADQGVHRINAPQIEYPNHPIEQEHIQQAMKAAPDANLQRELAKLVASLGVRPKGHPERAHLAGTIDQDFAQSNDPLPQNFDFAVWNAAWPDQQTPHLQGDEYIALMNLCAAEAPAALLDKSGNTVLKLALPGNTVRLMVRLESGEIFMHPMHIDTLLIEPQLQRIELVWRTVLAIDEQAPIRAAEVHAMTAETTRHFDEQVQMWRNLYDQSPQPYGLATSADEAMHGH